MNLEPAPEDIAVRDAARAWLADHAPQQPLRHFEERRAWHRALYDAGYVGMGWPRKWGGGGASVMAEAFVAAAIAETGAPGPINLEGLDVAGPSILTAGTEAQKARYLQPILAATELWCQLYSEPDAGSDLAALRTTAVRDSAGFVANGQKLWTSEAMRADLGVLLARTDPTAPKHRGITCFIVDMRQPGVEVRPVRQATGANDFCEVFLTDVRLDEDSVIGAVDGGWSVAMAALGYERGASALVRVTRYQVAFRRLIGSIQRIAPGRLRDSHVRHRLGETVAHLHLHRLNALAILADIANGTAPGARASIVKLAGSEFERRLHDLAQDLLGPHGQLTGDGAPDDLLVGTSSGGEGAWAEALLWSRAVTVFGGTSEIQRNIIADQVLDLPRDLRADRRAA